MTIKHQNKNISAEKQYVITDVQDNPNGILTFILSDLYSNTTDTLQIDLSKHKLTLTKVTQSELNRLKNSKDEIDIKNRESHIYLVQKNTNDEGIYQEFIWVDNDFEIVGSTNINLEPYFLKENVYNGLDFSQNNNTKALSAYQGYLLNQNKVNKSDIVTNLTTDNDNKVLSAKQGKLLQDNKLNKNQIPHKGKNVVVDNNSGEITFEDKPTIPKASTTTPLSDSTNGITGNSDKWAKADHVHPKSNLYAESGHNHDSTYIKLSNTTGLVKNDGTIDTSQYLIKSNFKTIDGNSIVGSGNISLPSKLSDLTNDAGFITSAALNDYVTKDNLSIKYSNEIPTEVDPSEPYSLCIVKSSNGYDVYSIQSTGWVKSATIPSDFAISSHNHNDLYYTKSEVDNMNLGSGSSGEVDLSNYIRKSSTSGLVKNDGSIDTTSYLSSLPNHTHKKSEITDFPAIPDVSNYIKKSSTSGLVKNDGSIDTTSYLSSLPNHTHKKSEITDFTHTHSISDVTTLQTTLNGKANTSHTHTTSEITDFPAIPDVSNYIQKSSVTGFVKNDGSIDSNEYVTSQDLYDNTPINYVVTSTDNTFNEGDSTFIVGKNYYFIVRTFQGLNEVRLTSIRCEIYHSGKIEVLSPPAEPDFWENVFEFTPMEQKGYVLKVYDSDTLVATYTFDAIIDTGWQEVTFKSGYSKYNNSSSVYIRRKGNFVELTGVWKPTSKKSAASNPVTFASIPDELKPTKSINVICAGVGKNTYRLTVETDGELKWCQYGTTTSIDLSENSFCHVRCTWTI